MAKRTKLRALNPQPWFPGLKQSEPEYTHEDCGFPIDVRRMFYIPKYGKHLDGRWMKRCVDRWLDGLGDAVDANTIIDAHFGYPDGVGCYLAARERGLPLFITIRGLEVDLFDHPRIGPQLIEALNYATGVIAVSESLRGEAVAAGVKAEQIEVIPNGVDTDFFVPGDRLDMPGTNWDCQQGSN